VQVVQFMTNVDSINPERMPYKLNSLLPHDIRIKWMSQTAPDFSVTVTAKHKVSGKAFGRDVQQLVLAGIAAALAALGSSGRLVMELLGGGLSRGIFYQRGVLSNTMGLAPFGCRRWSSL
jgi:hypothetical protein